MRFEVSSEQINAKGEFHWYFRHLFYYNSVDYLTSKVGGFETRRDAERAAKAYIPQAEKERNAIINELERAQ